MTKIGIINYGVGNLGSVQNAFSFIAKHNDMPSFEVHIESSPDKLKSYDKLLLPGVGAFGNAMEHLRENSLNEAIIEFTKSGKLLLGICLGMQLLFEKSFEFGEHRGLGLISGEVVAFKTNTMLKVPHVGWNSCIFTPRGEHSPLFNGILNGSFFYFVHSFHIRTNEDSILAMCEYGYPFGAIINKDNIFGIQAHPEKSHTIGLKLLANFLKL